MKIYLVGGALRDRLLNIPVKDRDWLVVGGTEEEMLRQGFERLDGVFPVFRHPESGEEYALARRETKQGAGYKGFSVEYGPDVTLEEDLQRRDFTINALVEDKRGELIDLVGGLADIEQRRLRHITPAFVEDPVRLLRAARFIARLSRYGFSVAHETFDLMKQMAQPQEVAALKQERVWQEMKQAIAAPEPWRFFELLQRCGALAGLLPELSLNMGGDLTQGTHQPSESMQVLRRAVAAGADPQIRFAVLFAPLCQGPGGTGWLLKALPVERPYLELIKQIQSVVRFYSLAAKGDAAAMLDLLVRGRAQQQPSRFAQLAQACALLWPTEGEMIEARLEPALQAVASISPAELSREGFQGEELGRTLRARQIAAISALDNPADQ